MNRAITAAVVAAVLLAGAILAEKRLQTVERADPLGRELLYLPSPEMLKLASLGNEGFIANLIYLWSIQYYGQYEPHDRFLYLEPVFNLITDLDPLFHDAYRVGALIMQLPMTEEDKHKAAVIRLFDKALEAMPTNHEIAEAAGWDMFIRYRDKAESIRYFEAAVAMPDAPHRLRRFLGVWKDETQHWTFDDAIEYWMEVREEATTPYDRTVCDRQIYRLFATRDAQQLDPVLRNWSLWHGRCPSNWNELIESGFLRDVPHDYFGQPYRIVPDSCTAMGADSVRFD